jgi:hypothetical protein
MITQDQAGEIASDVFGLPVERLTFEDTDGGWIVSVEETPEAFQDELIGSAKLYIDATDSSVRTFPSWPNSLIEQELSRTGTLS